MVSVLKRLIDRWRRPRPRSVFVDVTYRCNLQCVHCNVRGLAPDGRDEVSAREWRRIFRELHEAGTRKLTLTGGELLMRPDWAKIARAASRYFRLSLFTNATLVTPADALEMARIAPERVEVSAYGADQAGYGRITQSAGAYDHFQRGMRLLRGAGLEVSVKGLLLRESAAQMRQMEAACGGRLRWGVRISPPFDGSQEQTDLRPTDAQLLRFFASGKAGKLTFATAARPCDTARTGCVITAHGDVHPCGLLPMSLGNLREQRFAEIWLGARAEGLRASTQREPQACAACELRAWCRPCWGMNWLETGKLARPSREVCRLARLRRQADQAARGG